MITPQEIESKAFASAVRGYKKEEVDVFLDEIMLDYQELINENGKLRRNVEELNRQMAESKKSETSVIKTLEEAKSLMSDISASAEKRAEVIIKDAQLEAEKITREARESISRLTEESEQLKKKVSSFKERYRKMLNDELSRMDVHGDDFFEDLKDDFFPASMEERKASDDHGSAGVFDDRRTSELDFSDLGIEEDVRNVPDASATLTEKVFSELNGGTFDDKAKTMVVNDVDGLLSKKTRIIK